MALRRRRAAETTEPYSAGGVSATLPVAEKRVSTIGAGDMSAGLVDSIKSAVADAMNDARSEIAGATAELVAEIRDGSKAVTRTIQAEAMTVRSEFGEIAGNSEAAADGANRGR